jgi:uncharacterized protein
MFRTPGERAYVIPFAVFMLLLAATGMVQSAAGYTTSLLLIEPKYWIYPLQTVVCGILLLRYWSYYRFHRPVNLLLTIVIAGLVLALWISPQWLFGAARRETGFDLSIFENNPPVYWTELVFRFVRLVVVVPLVEEIFWRGFLLRFVIREDFLEVPFGKFTWGSFGAVTLCFGLAHWGPDFVPALITGALYNLIAYKTKSLASCVLAHALTNLGLGIYILQTRQWGFW